MGSGSPLHDDRYMSKGKTKAEGKLQYTRHERAEAANLDQQIGIRSNWGHLERAHEMLRCPTKGILEGGGGGVAATPRVSCGRRSVNDPR